MDPRDDDSDSTARAAANQPLNDRERAALQRADSFIDQRRFAAGRQLSLRSGLEIAAGLAVGAAVIAAILLFATHRTSTSVPAPAGHSPQATVLPSQSPAPSFAPTQMPSSAPLTAGTCLPQQNYPDFMPTIEALGRQHVWALVNSQILSSHDGGTSWKAEFTDTSGNLMGLDAIDDEHAWVVTDSLGLLRTTDGGNSWQQLAPPGSGTLGTVHFVSDLVGYGIAGSCTVVRTDDGGASWASLPSSPVGASSLCFVDSTNGWVGGGSSVWRTKDGGSTWSEVLHADPTNIQSGLELRLECGAPDSVSVEASALGGAAGSDPNAAWVSIGGDQFTEVWRSGMWQDTTGSPTGPGSYPGPFSLVNQTDTAWIGVTPAQSPYESTLAQSSKTQLDPSRPVTCDGAAIAAAFISGSEGWVTCTQMGMPTVIDHTNDGGSTWSRQFTSG